MVNLRDVPSLVSRIKGWFYREPEPEPETAEFAGGMFDTVGGGSTPLAFTNATSNGAQVGQPIGWSGSVLDTVPMPPDMEVVSANGTWAGIGAMNMQVLSQGVNSHGERLDTLTIQAMLQDDAVKPAVDTIKFRILCGELTFHPSVEPDDDSDTGGTSTIGADPKEAQRAADFMKRCFDNLDVPFHIWAWDFLDYMVYGNKVAEKVLEEVLEGPDAGFYILKSLKVKGRWAYHLCTDPYLNLVAIYAQTIIGPAYIDKSHFLIGSNGIEDGDPRGTTILRAARDAWRRKQRALVSRSKGDDQFGTPSIAFEMAEGTLVEGQETDPRTGKPITAADEANRELQKFQAGTTFSHMNGGKVYVIESQRNGEQINASLDDYDRRITRAIVLSSKATMEAKHYTQGGGEIGDDLISVVADFRRDELLGFITKQVCHYILTVNKGKAYADMYTPKLRMGSQEYEELAKLANPLAAMGSAGLMYKTWLVHLMTLAGFPRPKPGELRLGTTGAIPDEVPEPKIAAPGKPEPAKKEAA